ncbi:hypothetical protein CSUI_006980 [Cystoisospora suis]|uniref:Transmembrane protein n=1 Tax=Cystoisospora suis TaxID=483139 RepID=A0A2C6KS74_9APIC|nr:hypothetical protein CSUI_006980 [Cystoisospora suis]
MMTVLFARGREISSSPVRRRASVVLHRQRPKTRQPDVGVSQGRRREVAGQRQCLHTHFPEDKIRSPGSFPYCRQACAVSSCSSPFLNPGVSPYSLSVHSLWETLSRNSFPTSSLVTPRPVLPGSLTGRLSFSYAYSPPSFVICRQLSCCFSLTSVFPPLLGLRSSPSRTLSSFSSAIVGRLAEEVRRGGEGGRSEQLSSSRCTPHSQDRTLPYTPQGPSMSFSSSTSSYRFQELLHRLEEEEALKRREEQNKGRSSDSCSFSSSVAGESEKERREQETSPPPSPNGQTPLTIAPTSQREILQHLLSSYKAYYSRHFFYPGSPTSSSTFRVSEANNTCPPSTTSSSTSSSSPSSLSPFLSQSAKFLSTISLALALLFIQLGLWGMSLYLSHSRFSGISTSSEARESADFFLRFRLLFTLSPEQISLLSLMPWSQKPPVSSSEVLSSSSSPLDSSSQSPSSSSSLSLPSLSSTPTSSSLQSSSSSSGLASPSTCSSSSSLFSFLSLLPSSVSFEGVVFSDLPRLLLPSLMPSEVSPQAALLKMSCLFLSTSIVQRTIGFFPTLVALFFGTTGSTLISLVGYSYYFSNVYEAEAQTKTTRSSKTVEGGTTLEELENSNSAETDQRTSFLVSGTWGHLAVASAIAACTPERWFSPTDSSRKNTSPSTFPSSSSPLRDYDRQKQSLEKANRKLSPGYLSPASPFSPSHGSTSRRGIFSPSIRRRIPSIWPQVPIAAAALAVPVFAEVLIRGPQHFEAFSHKRGVRKDLSAKKAEQQREGERDRDDEDERQSRRSGVRRSLSVVEGNTGSEEHGICDPRKNKLHQNGTGSKDVAPEAQEKPGPTGHDDSLKVVPSSPDSTHSLALSSSTSLTVHKKDRSVLVTPGGGVGDIQKQLLYQTCLVQGIETALEKQKEEGDCRSRDLQKLKLTSQRALTAWERRWEEAFQDIPDLRLLGDITVFLIASVCSKLFFTRF